MNEGLWTVVFSSGGIAGGGIIYLANGRALGGDSQYFYRGSYVYDSKASTFQATVEVIAFVSGAVTVFGMPISAYSLDVKGTVSGDSATATAQVREWPTAKLQMQLVRRADKIAP